MDNQISLFDLEPKQMDALCDKKINVVKTVFSDHQKVSWHELFEGFDELYGITFSSGIHFMEKVFGSFEHVEIIFGFEGILSDDLATIISTQIKSVEKLVKSKSAIKIAERMEKGEINIYVSRDTKSHEKIFILKAKDGRVRVITGSANMSASAFLGIQRENIMCFDDVKAYEYYIELFEDFKDKCSDSVSEKVVNALLQDDDYIRDNIDETPIIKTVQEKKIVFLQPQEDSEDAEIIADVRGLRDEIKPLLPRVKPENGKIILTGETTKAFRRKYEEHANVKKTREKKLPKLHIDYENKSLSFNGKELSLNPDTDKIKHDVLCLTNYISSLSSFYGDYSRSQKDYYKFLNWYFCSPFMPYLRYVGSKNEHALTAFPVVGILYGDSNGGKSTFVNLLSKLMTGVKITPSSSNDFTSGNISNLKAACEGVPINIDDLAKAQYEAHFEKVIKDDGWGILERYINYPAVVISTNKLPSLKADISKRVVTCRIDIKIDKESGAYNSKRINESMKQATNSLFCEYVRRMFIVIDKMEISMKNDDDRYFPDILKESSIVLKNIIEEFCDELPEYVTDLSYSDYFGDLAIGKHAIDQIKTAWQNEPKSFKIEPKKNKLIYTYPEAGRLYELRYLQDELPPALECKVISRSLVMNLDAATEIFGEKFKRKLLS